VEPNPAGLQFHKVYVTEQPAMRYELILFTASILVVPFYQ